MFFYRSLIVFTANLLFVCFAAGATPLVTGNGFGFGVVSGEGTLTKFYAHPYSFAKPDPSDPLSEGIETTNFIKRVQWSDGAVPDASMSYVEDSHVIRVRSSAGQGIFFMPFGLRMTALVIDWKSNSAAGPRGHWNVEWSHPIKSQSVLRVFGSNVQVLRF